MARGFSTGLIHGAVVGMAALIGALVIWPPSDLPDTGRIETDASPVTNRLDDAALSDRAPALQDDDGQARAPDAGIVDIPAGSEFGRAADLSPVAPAPLSPVTSGTGAPLSAVKAPEQETLPSPEMALAGRPATVSQSVGAAPVVEISPAVTELPMVPAEDALGTGPDQGLMPGRFIPAGPDTSPQQPEAPMTLGADHNPPAVLPDLSNLPGLDQLSPDLANVGAEGPPVAAPQDAPAARQQPVRSLALPGPDLSLPPSMGGLGLGGIP